MQDILQHEIQKAIGKGSVPPSNIGNEYCRVSKAKFDEMYDMLAAGTLRAEFNRVMTPVGRKQEVLKRQIRCFATFLEHAGLPAAQRLRGSEWRCIRFLETKDGGLAMKVIGE